MAPLGLALSSVAPLWIALSWQLAGEGGLAVGPGRDEPLPATAAPAGAVAQEVADRRAALELQRDRRHREPGVVGQQRDHPVDVIGGVSGREPRRQIALAGRFLPLPPVWPNRSPSASLRLASLGTDCPA